MNTRLIYAWFERWLKDPVYFWSFEGYSMSLEWQFVKAAVVALGDD